MTFWASEAAEAAETTVNMVNFWDTGVWGTFNLVAVLLASLLLATVMKKSIRVLREALIPTSVLGGILLLIIGSIYSALTGSNIFDTGFFGGNGIDKLETITYHALALGFIASALRSTGGKLSKQRTTEIFNTGVTTVSTYLLQAVFGLSITIVAAWILTDFFPAAGILLPFGYGQGTGQALNYGGIFETDYGFVGGRSFGLTVAALGFLSASIGGVIHLNLLRRRGVVGKAGLEAEAEMPRREVRMNGSMDKITVQIALIALAYILTSLIMMGLGKLLPGMKSLIYGFNFLIGVLVATVMKPVLRAIKPFRNSTDNFLLSRCSNFFYDIMVVAGIAAIRLSILEKYWGVMLILGVVGLVITYAYNYFVAKKLFPGYVQEQFLAMYGMLTGTASTGIILLREVDGQFKTPASDNLVYQNFPAIVFGFPLMFLATLAPKKPYLTLGILFAFFVVMNLILFRSAIFKKRQKK